MSSPVRPNPDFVVLVGGPPDRIDGFARLAHELGLKLAVVDTHEFIQENRAALAKLDIDVLVAIPGSDVDDNAVNDENAVADAIMSTGALWPLPVGNQEYELPVTHRAIRVLQRRGVIVISPNAGFVPLQKLGQLQALSQTEFARRFAELPDPATDAGLEDAVRIVAAFSQGFSRPSVTKATPGGDGLGVNEVKSEREVRNALAGLRSLPTHRSVRHSQFHVEDVIEGGTNVSAHAVVQANGEVKVLAWSQKVTRKVPARTFDQSRQSPGIVPGFLTGYYEVTHVVHAGESAPSALVDLSATFADKSRYKAGAFHVDAQIVGPRTGGFDLVRLEDLQGDAVFVEGGYRHSGRGICRLVAEVSGYDWQEEALASLLGIELAPPSNERRPEAIATRALRGEEVRIVRQLVRDFGIPFDIREHSHRRSGPVPRSQQAEAIWASDATVTLSGSTELVYATMNVLDATIRSQPTHAIAASPMTLGL